MSVEWRNGVKCAVKWRNTPFSHDSQPTLSMTAPAFTLIFLLFVALSFAFGSMLTLRHIAHVRANRAAVPAEFTESITLESHQKAADYTIEKNRLGLIESVFDLKYLGISVSKTAIISSSGCQKVGSPPVRTI